jgi:hypothetical protein
MLLIREPRTAEAKGHQMRIAAVLASVAQVNVSRGAGCRGQRRRRCRTWAWVPAAGMQYLCLHTRWCARLSCTALREAPEASIASRESRQRVCGLDALLHRRNMAGSTARCFRLTLSTSTSPATAGFAPSVSRQWPVSACSSETPARLQLRAPAVAFSPAWVGELAGQSVGCLPRRYWQRPAVSVLQGVAAPAAGPICATPLICCCSCMLRQSANAYTF